MNFKGDFIPVSWFWVVFHATSVQMDSVHQYLEQGKHFSIFVHLIEPFFESEVEVEGRRSSSLPRDPNARTVAWSYQGVVSVSWVEVFARKGLRRLLYLPPFNHGSLEIVPIQKEKQILLEAY